jgi:glycosyltransferase involved in cell wall biosynthesis
MVQEKNGLVVPQDPVAVADAIERLLTDKSLYDSIVSYLAQESFDSDNTLLQFYGLLGNSPKA